MTIKSALEAIGTRVGGLRASLISVFFFVWQVFDIRDVFIFGGLSMLGYGLYLLFPWLAFSICGLALMLLGLGWIVRSPKK